MKIDLQIDDQEAQELLSRIQEAGKNPAPALKQIGELLVDSTKRRFQASRSPDGSPWAPNTQTTLLGHLGRFQGSYNKDGRLSARGARRASGKKPLIGETRSLSTTIHYRVFGTTLDIGSPMEYAAVQQFGAKKGAFGTTSRGTSIPWGDIPARPFLGVSTDDWQTIRSVFSDYLLR